MGWVRSNIRLGTRLALIALALQFAATFGHVHGFEPPATAVAATVQASGPEAPDTDHDHRAADLCAVCVATAMAGAMLAAAPPALPLRLAAASPAGLTGGGRIDPSRPSDAFQPRGPPLS